MARSKSLLLAYLLTLAVTGCSQDGAAPEDTLKAADPSIQKRPSILLVTLDTTRADRLGIETNSVDTPHLEALASRGRYFQQAYSVTPTTLPSHTSMLTGLYPTDHGIRENGRRVDGKLDLLPALLRKRGYATAGFISGFPLASQFGLARGFDHFDDTFVSDAAERSATETTDLAVAYLKRSKEPTFLWVHYFDPHEPYEPPEPFRSLYPNDPYLGEIAFMDQELGRLINTLEQQPEGEPWNIIVVGDHGEGLGDHGETLHGNLLYQSTMRVPLIVVGNRIPPGTTDRAVSVRQVFATVLGWAGDKRPGGLLEEVREPVLAEALKPYMQYGWQPQFMAVLDNIKLIQSGDIEVYDLRVDPGETKNLVDEIALEPALLGAISAYSTQALEEQNMEPQQRPLNHKAIERLASLGYVSSSGSHPLREDAPNPRDMTHIYHDLDIGAGLFIGHQYAAAIPVFTRILQTDPNNFVAALRLAVAHSVIDEGDEAQQFFDRAKTINPTSIDLRHYQAMHYLRDQKWNRARPLFESVLAEMPERLPALEGLAQIYTRQNELKKAAALFEKIVNIKESPGLELTRLGQLSMAQRNSGGAIRAFEKAREILGNDFTFHLELGVLYLAEKRFTEAASSLDKVSSQHPGYPMALFKRAQVSIILKEPGNQARVRRAWQHGNETTRSLMESEKLFQTISFR